MEEIFEGPGPANTQIILRMVAFVVAVMITCFHAQGKLQKAVTGACWVLTTFLVALVVYASLREFGAEDPDDGSEDEDDDYGRFVPKGRVAQSIKSQPSTIEGENSGLNDSDIPLKDLSVTSDSVSSLLSRRPTNDIKGKGREGPGVSEPDLEKGQNLGQVLSSG